MIEYFKNKEINQTKWNDCVYSSINFRVFAFSWYLDIACDDWDALVLNDYEAVMPLPFKIKKIKKYIFPPYFVPQLGVFSKEPITEDLLMQFINAIPSEYMFAEIRLNTQTHAPKKIEAETNRTFLLELVEPYEQLYAKYSQNTKRNIKKAEQSGLQIHNSGSIPNLIKLFRNSNIAKKSNFKDQDYRRLEKLMYVHLSMHFGQILMVYDKQNTLQAGAFFMVVESQAYFIFSGRGGESEQNGAMFYLINEFIKNNSGKNLVLDFCGSNSDSLGRFYQGFGSKPAHYQMIRVFPDNLFFREFYFKAYKWLKSIV